MTIEAWLLLAAILVLDTGSHLALKSASMRAAEVTGRHHILALLSQPTLWFAIVAFVVLFLAWIAFISLVPLSQGIMAGSITIAGVMLGGRIFFGEHITLWRGLAVGLIAVGVLLVGRGAA
jgi:drug/metabolite transporter (DMT)-like permease